MKYLVTHEDKAERERLAAIEACLHPSFVIFARLGQGLGTIPFRVDIRLAGSGRFVAGTLVHHLVFPDRDTIVNMVVTMKGVLFPQPGIYLVELLLDNQWAADTTLELK